MLNKVKEWLCGFTGDKYMHVIACCLIAYLFAETLRFNVFLCACIGFVVAMVSGVLKETLIDDSVDKTDIKADAIGAVLGAILSLL